MTTPIELPIPIIIDVPIKINAPFTLPVPSKGAPKSLPPRRLTIEPNDYKIASPPCFDTPPTFPMGEPMWTGPMPQRRNPQKPG